MKKDFNINGADFSVTVPFSGDTAWDLRLANGARCRASGALCANFSEGNALTRKMRVHFSEDGLEAASETERTLPFGCEYDLRRGVTIFGGGLLTTVDCSPDHGGRLAAFELDPLTFSGKWSRIGLDDGSGLQWQEISGGKTVFYDGSTPLLRVVLGGTDGSLLESGCGEDVWRHRVAAAYPGCSGKFTVTGDGAEIVMTRRILSFDTADETLEIPKRPWRFSYYVAWAMPCAAPEKPTVEITDLDIPESGFRPAGGVCMAAPAVKRRLRELVRGSAGDLTLGGITAGVCGVASHMGRSTRQELEHWGMSECLSFYLWANRQLRKKGASCRLNMQDSGAGATVLGGKLQGLEMVEKSEKGNKR